MYITIQQAKKHLNLEAEFEDDDVYLSSLIEVAEAVVENHIHQKLTDVAIANGDVLPKPLAHAMLLMLGNFYSNREIVSFASKTSAIPYNYQYLLDPYINYLN